MENLKKLNPSGNDYFIKQIIENGKTRFKIIMCLAMFLALLPIVSSILSGNFINKTLYVDALRDIAYYAQFLVVTPFFIFFLPYYFNGLKEAILELSNKRTLTLDNEDCENAVNYANLLFENRIVTFLVYQLYCQFV